MGREEGDAAGSSAPQLSVGTDNALELAAFTRHYLGPGDASDAWRWLVDPSLPASDGGPGPAVRLAEARAALYRPDAAGEGVEGLRAVQAEVEEVLGAARAAREAAAADLAVDARVLPASRLKTRQDEAAVDAPRNPTTSWRRRHGRGMLLAIGAALVGGVLIGVLLTSLGRDAETSVRPLTAQQRIAADVVGSGGTLTALDYFRAYPEALPAGWGEPSGTVLRRQTNFTQASLRVSGVSAALLVFVTCPDTARRGFYWTIRRDDEILANGSGLCGRIQGQQALLTNSRGQQVQLRTEVPSGAGYSVSVLQR